MSELITDNQYILRFLKKALIGSYYDRYSYYVTGFQLEWINEAFPFTAEMHVSDFELADKEEWNHWINSHPFNMPNLSGPGEPAKGFLVTLLTQVCIEEVEVEYQGTLIFHFANGVKVRIKGEEEITDISWMIYFKNAADGKIGELNCSFNELFLRMSPQLLALLR